MKGADGREADEGGRGGGEHGEVRYACAVEYSMHMDIRRRLEGWECHLNRRVLLRKRTSWSRICAAFYSQEASKDAALLAADEGASEAGTSARVARERCTVIQGLRRRLGVRSARDWQLARATRTGTPCHVLRDFGATVDGFVLVLVLVLVVRCHGARHGGITTSI